RLRDNPKECLEDEVQGIHQRRGRRAPCARPGYRSRRGEASGCSSDRCPAFRGVPASEDHAREYEDLREEDSPEGHASPAGQAHHETTQGEEAAESVRPMVDLWL